MKTSLQTLMIGINNLSVEFSSKPLFNNISFTINQNDRIALVGKNGAGKSTLLKIIAGLQNPSSGAVSFPSDFSIGYLPQEMKISDETTLIEETKKAFSKKQQLEEEFNALNSKIENSTAFESEEYLKLMSRAEELRDRLQMQFPGNQEAETERTLLGLGFKKEDFNRPTSEFSGGWRMRIELAKILLQRPDLLLLDEPTNHLDINSIQWLEQFLINKAGAVLLVSHDRAFLDNVTKRTVEISCGKIYDYKVSYSPFVALRQERIEQQKKAYINQQKMIDDTKQFIEKFRYKATKAVQVQSRIKQLEKIVPIEIDEVDNSSVNFKFPAAERSGDFPLIIEDVAKAYGNHQVFSNANLTLRRGEKIAFVGSNGEGKSTMVKCIMNQIPFDGNLKIGHNVKIGYFAQNQAQLLDKNKTVFETLDDVATGDIRTKLKDLLAAFLFRGEDIDKKVEVLSGGEKTRLAMAKLLLQPVNFLILDEPTNHLDMRTKDVLKNALSDFNGTIILVSHDRDFLNGVVDKVYEFADGKVRESLGGIYEFIEKKRKASQPELQSSKLEEPVKNEESASLSYAEKKERDKKLKKAIRNLENAEKAVTEFENALTQIETKLSEGVADSQTLQKYQELKENLDSAITNWENAQIELDGLKEIQNL